MTATTINENTGRDEIISTLEAAFNVANQQETKVFFDFQANGTAVADKRGTVGTTVTLSKVEEPAGFRFIIQGTRNGTEWHRSGKYKGADTLEATIKRAALDVLGSFTRATVKGSKPAAEATEV